MIVTTDAAGNSASGVGAAFAGIASNTTAVQTNAAGIANLRNDVSRNRNDIDEATEGVAMAVAIASAHPYLTQVESFAISGSLGTFEGENALAFGARVKVGQRWLLCKAPCLCATSL